MADQFNIKQDNEQNIQVVASLSDELEHTGKIVTELSSPLEFVVYLFTELGPMCMNNIIIGLNSSIEEFYNEGGSDNWAYQEYVWIVNNPIEVVSQLISKGYLRLKSNS